MVRETSASEKLRDAAKDLKRQAAELFKEANDLLRRADRLDLIRGGEPVLRKSVNWKTADSLEVILENGKKSIPRAELEKMLVKGDHVKGQTDQKKLESAKSAITVGLDKEYLIETPKGIGYVPGARKSKVRKKV
jgi:hypothetical protein